MTLDAFQLLLEQGKLCVPSAVCPEQSCLVECCDMLAACSAIQGWPEGCAMYQALAQILHSRCGDSSDILHASLMETVRVSY